ncbi:unnamed protein product [Discosporangium mesarthrocarpum]
MSEGFTSRPGDRVSTGEVVRVRIKFADPEGGKLGLSMVEEDAGVPEHLPKPPRLPGITLSQVKRGSELWGFVARVTNYGAYVEVGAEVQGFLHILEYPSRQEGQMAPDVFVRNQRLRVYASEVDLEGRRLKLTCVRPRSLPHVGEGSAALGPDEDDEEYDGFTYKSKVEEEEEEEEEEGEEEGWEDEEEEDGDDHEDDEEEEGEEEWERGGEGVGQHFSDAELRGGSVVATSALGEFY